MNDDDFKLLRGFTDRPMDKRTDICECRRKERKKISTLDNSFKPIFFIQYDKIDWQKSTNAQEKFKIGNVLSKAEY